MMRNNPYVLMFGLFFALFLGARGWRRRLLKRAVRDLPTRLRRQVGDEPDFLPPEDLPVEMEAYASLHRRSARIMHGVWGLAFGWLAYVFYLLLEHLQ